ncbi:hypothetical protein [Desulfosoma caldarium]|uniref:hypothetical protein n=1 Tax=Desulfosoma caldarium TaxID=610254 RepID=UPI000F492FEC|nr:hypothetical protein [Desulfosoma caldarium]
MGQSIHAALTRAGYGPWLQGQGILAEDHGRGSEEWVHRALKDFGFEQLPFKRFAPNAAFFDTMLVAFFLYESFKHDVCAPVVEPVG